MGRPARSPKRVTIGAARPTARRMGLDPGTHGPTRRVLQPHCPAVDGVERRCDERGVVGQEKFHDCCDFIRLAISLHRR